MHTRATLLKILIFYEIFLANLLKKFGRKDFFSNIFVKNLYWQVIPSWVIISYKIIKFISISYKICCEKCFIQNILQKKWEQFHAIFFITKCISIFYKTKSQQNG